jgi:hypothetical protein
VAITQDILYVDTVVKTFTQSVALNLGSASAFKGAMFTNSVSPNASATNPAYGSSPWNANEVSGTGYTAGGLAMTSAAFIEHPSSAGSVRWDADDLVWTGATITNARGLLIYVPGLSNRAVVLRAFGSDYSSADGNFSVIFHATDGIFKLRLVSP